MTRTTMKITINGEDKIIPSSLAEITLKQRIDFQELHGNLLNEMLKSILAIEDEFERELELSLFQFEKMIRTVSFFTDCTPEAIKESEYVDTIAQWYFSGAENIAKEEREYEIEQADVFLWRGETWKLSPPLLKHGDKMTFGEVIDSKQIIQNMVNLGKNRWECLIPLAAIFLRREGEEYLESYLYEDSDRLKLMEELPLDIALQVGFFLTNSLITFSRHSPFSALPGLSRVEKTSNSILSSLDG